MPALFNHLVGDREQRRWNFQSKRLRSLEIYDEFKFRGLNDRQIGGFFALQNPAHVDARPLISCLKPVSITDQAAVLCKLTKWINRGNCQMSRQCDDLVAPTEMVAPGTYDECSGLLQMAGECRIDIACGADAKDDELQPESACSLLNLSYVQGGG